MTEYINAKHSGLHKDLIELTNFRQWDHFASIKDINQKALCSLPWT